MIGQYNIVDSGVCRLADLYASHRITPAESVSFYLEKISQLNSQLNAFVYIDYKGAQRAASLSTHRWLLGKTLSPCDGIPIALKANIGVQGWPWHAGIKAYKHRLASKHAAIVDRLLAAGFIILGLTNMDEGALGATGDNHWLGRCQNPHQRGLSPGGSSGGCATAVAAGLCAAAVGTDTMGSVRIPAAYCGIAGHKPSATWVPVDGVVPLSANYDTLGLLARNCNDVAKLLSVLSARNMNLGLMGISHDLRLARLGYSSCIECDDRVKALFASRVEQMAIQFGEIPSVDCPLNDIQRLRRKLLLIAEIEAQWEHADMLNKQPNAFSAEFRAMMTFGKNRVQERPQEVDRLRSELFEAGRQVQSAFEPFDVIISPTTPQPAFAFAGPIPDNQADFSILANLAGLPATTAFIGSTEQGLPVGMQIMAKHGQDDKTLSVGKVAEKIV